MHPTILQQLAEARVADLHREAERRQLARAARRGRAKRGATTLLSQPVLDRIRALLRATKPERAG